MEYHEACGGGLQAWVVPYQMVHSIHEASMQLGCPDQARPLVPPLGSPGVPAASLACTASIPLDNVIQRSVSSTCQRQYTRQCKDVAAAKVVYGMKGNKLPTSWLHSTLYES